jgi:RNA polymerase sigma factor (TIGR02999 family)
MSGPLDRPDDITDLLLEWRAGDAKALETLTPLVYAELRAIARRQIRREARNLTLGATGLAHEAFIRLVDQRQAKWQNRAHFLAIAAGMMRRILVDHARRRQAAKRDGVKGSLSLADVVEGERLPDVEILGLHHALSELTALDERQARVVELRYFGGLTIEETAEVIGISAATVKREWEVARLWLRRRLRGDHPT